MGDAEGLSVAKGVRWCCGFRGEGEVRADEDEDVGFINAKTKRKLVLYGIGTRKGALGVCKSRLKRLLSCESR